DNYCPHILTARRPTRVMGANHVTWTSCGHVTARSQSSFFVPVREGMIVVKADRPSVKSNEANRVLLTLVGLLSIVTLDFSPPLRITDTLGDALSLWYRDCLLLKSAVSVTFVTHSCSKLITDAAIPLMLRHDMSSSTLLLKRGTI